MSSVVIDDTHSKFKIGKCILFFKIIIIFGFKQNNTFSSFLMVFKNYFI